MKKEYGDRSAGTDRRTFLSQAAASMAAFSVAGQQSPPAHPAQTIAQEKAEHEKSNGSARAMNGALLAALGESLLPESLGAAGRARAVHAFSTWIAGYTPVSEEMHGYGYAEIRYTVADPAPGWNAQLQGLDLLAKKKLGSGLALLSAVKRNAFVREQLARVRGDRLPADPLSAPHIAVALLAHWAASSEAVDFAYGVRIGKDQCKSLADAPRKPLPLAGGKS